MGQKTVDVGGQAVIEGVMMRSPEYVTVAIRKSNGEIAVKKDRYISLSRRFKLLNLPIVRGVVALGETLYIGIKALTFSAEEAMEGASPSREKKGKKGKKGIFTSVWLIGTVTFAFILAFFLFFYLPLMVTSFLNIKGGFLFNLVDGIIRIAIFLIYIRVITLWREMGRIFEYHGAEHKSIHTFEAGENLLPTNAKKYSTLHPRCGTSFLLIVMIVSILIFMLLGRPHTLTDRLVRFLFIPLIAGISYELIKLSGKKRGSRIANVLVAPGLWLQKITTKEPNEKQLEVAIAALKKALDLK
ncbi:MAG: DUF1385 domain-containing protein [Candidatus Aerophobetes bacterium]|nr:DUF1385 domain-containing protein [Candidatus Aerophobetes bacterium]